MRKLLRLFLDFVFRAQQKSAKTVESQYLCSYSSDGTSSHITAYETVSFNSKTHDKALKLKAAVKKIVKKNIKTPHKLLEYVEKSGTKVIKTAHADKILSYIGEQEGFIVPKHGLEALYLNLILNRQIAFHTPEMFVLRNMPVNIYVMSHQFHKWYSYKLKLPGYDTQTQENFKKVFEFANPNNAQKLSYKEIMGLKEAIKRDCEAIDFVLELSREQEGTSIGLDKIKKGEGASV